MRIKSKPQRPKRKMIVETLSCDDMSLQSIVDWVRSFDGVELKEVIICNEWVDFDCSELEASFRRQESDSEFQVRLDTHKRRLSTYNEWYAANQDEIEFELARREDAHVQRAKRNIERERARLEKELEKLDRKGK